MKASGFGGGGCMLLLLVQRRVLRHLRPWKQYSGQLCGPGSEEAVGSTHSLPPGQDVNTSALQRHRLRVSPGCETGSFPGSVAGQ